MDCSLSGFSDNENFQARILELVAMSSSRGFSWPRDRTWVSCIASKFFTIWATGEAWGMNEEKLKKLSRDVISHWSCWDPVLLHGPGLPSCHHTSPRSPCHQFRATHPPSLRGICVLPTSRPLPLTSLRLSPTPHINCSHPLARALPLGRIPLMTLGCNSGVTPVSGPSFSAHHLVTAGCPPAAWAVPRPQYLTQPPGQMCSPGYQPPSLTYKTLS